MCVHETELTRAINRLGEYRSGHAYALPDTVQDAMAVEIPRDLVSSWLMYCTTNCPIHAVERFVWDIRRLVDGDYDFAVEWLRPVLWVWGDTEHLARLWDEADRSREDSDILVLEALASLYHDQREEEDGNGLWVLVSDANEYPVESEAIKRLHQLFYELDRTEIERLEKATGVTDPDAVSAVLERPLLSITQADLNKLSTRDRLRVELEIMMAAHSAISIEPSLSLPEHTNLTEQQALALEDFYAYLPGHTYIFTPTREMWPASSVNARIPAVHVPMRERPIPAATWLDRHRAVEQMTWAPRQSIVIADMLIADGGWIDRPGCKTFNLYRPPTIKSVAGDASKWVDHVRYIFGNDSDHIIKWLAHRVQFPDQKVNHALVLGGPQGIGKDTMLEPVKAAVGAWNFSEVSPQQMLGRFNGFVKSVILRISEARDLGETDRYAFYEHMKTLTAAPPDVLRVDEKHMREHSVLNVCGVIVTTNNKDSMHLPSDDRRHFVAWSARTKEDFASDYWSSLYQWFVGGGNSIVAHHLANLDLSHFDAKAPPPKTQAFWEMVDSSRAPEDAEMADAIDALGKPAAVTLSDILVRAVPDFSDWLRDRRNRRKIPHRFDECGYVPVRNPDATDGLWKIGNRRQVVYAQRQLNLRDQIDAASGLGVPSARPLPPLPTPMKGQSDQSNQ